MATGGWVRVPEELIDPQLQVAKLENGGETCPDYQANCLHGNTDANKTAHRRDFPLRQSSDQTDVPTREKNSLENVRLFDSVVHYDPHTEWFII